jgi:hypothetical protein
MMTGLLPVSRLKVLPPATHTFADGQDTANSWLTPVGRVPRVHELPLPIATAATRLASSPTSTQCVAVGQEIAQIVVKAGG